MSDQREYPQIAPAAVRSAPSLALHLSADRPQSDPRIEDYLDQVYAPLVGWVPYAARTELRAEMQVHVEALVAAYRELGSTPEVAVHAALAHSGDPQVVARAWEREWERVLPRRKAPPAWHSTLAALACFGIATRLLYEFIRAALEANLPGATPPEWLVSMPQWLWSTVAAVLLPFLAGLTTGILSRTRPAQAVLSALALLMPPTALALSSGDGGVAAFVVQLGITWIPAGCASATLGHWLRTRRAQAPKRRVIAA